MSNSRNRPPNTDNYISDLNTLLYSSLINMYNDNIRTITNGFSNFAGSGKRRIFVKIFSYWVDWLVKESKSHSFNLLKYVFELIPDITKIDNFPHEFNNENIISYFGLCN